MVPTPWKPLPPPDSVTQATRSVRPPPIQAGTDAQKDATPAVKSRTAVLCLIALFVALCAAVLPYAGIEADEALFAGPLYSEAPHSMKIRVFQHDVPLMLISYLGCAKTWLYGIVFHFWKPGVISLRLPVVLVGGLTLWAFYRLASRLAGQLTAVVATAILATDPMFVLTTTYDWGPVVIQHLTFVGGLLFVLSAVDAGTDDRRRALRIGIGFALFGLGMWDKAIFIWLLSGAAIGVLVLARRDVIKTFTRKNVLAAVVGFVIGAWPLLVYNIRNPLSTFRGNTVFSTEELEQKLVVFERTLSGSALFRYVVNEESAPRPRQARNSFETASLALRDALGEHRESILLYVAAAALLAAPLWWRRRKIVFFCLIVMAVAWVQMAFTKDAGTGVHHVVLLWPWPHLVIAVALVESARRLGRASRPVLTAAAGIVCVSNMLVLNQYVYQFIRDGSGPLWTDAIQPLSREVSHWSGRHIFMTDWGMDPTIRVLNRGDLKQLWNVSDVFAHDLSVGDRTQVETMLRLNGVFLTHTPAFEAQAGSAARLLPVATAMGLKRHLLATIDDSNGRHAFEVAEFVK